LVFLRLPAATLGSDRHESARSHRFLSELGGAGLDLWTAELVDRPPFDARSDTLESYHRLTMTGGYSAFDWHPDGTKLCALGPNGLSWVDAMSGAVTPINIPDSSLTRIATPTVYWRSGQHTLVAFQAQAENLSNLYLLDIEDHTLTRLLPFSMPVTAALYPALPSDEETDRLCQRLHGRGLGEHHRHVEQSPIASTRATRSCSGCDARYYPSVWVLGLE
jgi:hypothetical protein